MLNCKVNQYLMINNRIAMSKIIKCQSYTNIHFTNIIYAFRDLSKITNRTGRSAGQTRLHQAN